ncbi:hypothetical protein DSL64_15525 [Dyadobacter luteus]|uniref:Uncharacterized protein n=1 Tax=Dyadobacter luteus TaxID=2259619 RepID=A0A3D8Y9B3_9BACT|nr:hypothetical protein [Dyadobacter luteus]REA60089.1 hypothetical protein DSL64_15525 [Dyadobacter luteus]
MHMKVGKTSSISDLGRKCVAPIWYFNMRRGTNALGILSLEIGIVFNVATCLLYYRFLSSSLFAKLRIGELVLSSGQMG